MTASECLELRARRAASSIEITRILRYSAALPASGAAINICNSMVTVTYSFLSLNSAASQLLCPRHASLEAEP
jgi:hypothetical protein